MRFLSINRFFIAFSMAMLFAIPLFSQTSGKISGTVHDEEGGPLPGASIQAGNRTAFSNPDGSFSIDQQPGTYKVMVTLFNFSTFQENVLVESGKNVNLDVILVPSLSAQIVVTGKNTYSSPSDMSGSLDTLSGIADASSQGVVSGKQLDRKPFLRPGEVAESVPGVIVSQHSGEGKANQYYLRGFNLDHGTDLAISVNDIPVNNPTHGHGQGYADLNFLIPELISAVQYQKGPYDSTQGDFASVGSIKIRYVNFLEKGIARGTAGNQDYERGLIASSFQLGGGNLLYGLELSHNDGPWVNPDDFKKINGILRYSTGDAQNAFSITGMGYHGEWNSTDQVAARAIDTGLIDRFGAIDATDGGETHRYSLSTEWQHTWSNSVTQASAYLLDYKLNLFSNFTYFLDDPVNGDQFEQADDRTVAGFQAKQHWSWSLFGHDVLNEGGVQFRYDDIGNVGLYHTRARQRLSTTRQDSVAERSLGFYYENHIQWNEWLRSIAGIRADFFDFDVESNIAQNSGNADDSKASPRASLIFGPWNNTEYYFNFGFGYHSNDARGTTITVDPVTLEPAEKVDPLVRVKGYEVGARTNLLKGLEGTVALWQLDSDSELLFVGDAGITEASRPSLRYGIEMTLDYRVAPWLKFETDLAFSHARFSDFDPAGDRIPGAPNAVIALDAEIDNIHNFFGNVGVRYFGSRPLIEDNSVRSDSSTLVNSRIGYKIAKSFHLALDIFNLFDAEDSDIDYFYTSRLPGEPEEGIDDMHTHPVEPRAFRVSLTWQY
jgi:outer membrane receptor protein involved in Fe transport